MGDRIFVTRESGDWVPKTAMLSRPGWTAHMIAQLHQAGLITIKMFGRIEFVSESEIQRAIESLPAKDAKPKTKAQSRGHRREKRQGPVPDTHETRRAANLRELS